LATQKKKKNPAKLAVVTDLWPNDSGWLGKTLLAAPKCTFHIITKWARLCKVEIWMANQTGR